MILQTFDAFNKPNSIQKKEIAQFLFHHLGKYGDEISAIEKCINYAIKEKPSFGGFILLAQNSDEEIIGATIINKTGMEEYIPNNILVYIATHENERGKGIGKVLITKVIEKCKGGIALHVEADNPAKYLYEKLGFKNKYLEMRLS